MLVVRFAMLKLKPNYRANVGTFFEKAKFNFKISNLHRDFDECKAASCRLKP